jgi:hypothetical protein
MLRAGVAISVAMLAAACGKGANQPVFTEPPFTPEVTLAPSPTPAGTGSSQLQFQPLIGETIVLHVTGFQPGEKVTFTITKPDGTSFTGPPHVASTNGTVEARYSGAAAGTYTVVAKGDRGGQTTGQFTVNGSFTAAPRPTATPFRRRVTSTPAPTVHHTSTPVPTLTPAHT